MRMFRRSTASNTSNNNNNNAAGDDTASVGSLRSTGSSSVPSIRSSRVDRITNILPALSSSNASVGSSHRSSTSSKQSSQRRRKKTASTTTAQTFAAAQSSSSSSHQSPLQQSQHALDEEMPWQDDPHDQGIVNTTSRSSSSMREGIMRIMSVGSSSSSSIPPLSTASQSALQPPSQPHSQHSQSTGTNPVWITFCCRTTLILVILAALTIIVILVVVPHPWHDALQAQFQAFLEWVAHHPAQGVGAVTCVIALSTVLFLPAHALWTVGAGFAFAHATNNMVEGVVLGSLAVFCGAVLGSVSSFLLGRYLFREYVLNLAARYPTFRAVDQALQGHAGLKIMLLLRLSPLIPYNALDYISGVTSIPLWSYTVALIGMLPGTILFVALGATASTLTKDDDTNPLNPPANPQPTNNNNNAATQRLVDISALVGGLTFAISGVALASYYSKLELEKILEQERQERREAQRLPAFNRHSLHQQYNLHDFAHEETSSLT